MLADSASFGAFYACERRGIPLAILSTSVLAVRSRDTAPVPLGLHPSSSFLGRVRNRGLYVLTDFILRDVAAYADQIRAEAGLPPLRAPTPEKYFTACNLVLQPTTPEFEYPRSDLPDHVEFVGPLLPEAPIGMDLPKWWADLDGDHPVVLLTQGTARSDTSELIERTLAALEAEECLVVVTTGDAHLPPETLASLPSNARVERFLSYHHLLPHVDVMVTNAGYGGIQFALSYGVPIVAAGRTEEKAEICARVAWSGAGIDLKKHSPRPRAIRRAVREILDNPIYRRRADEISKQFSRADAPRTAADHLEHLVSRRGVARS